MKDAAYYSTGEFAKKAKVSIRTIRYYDKQGILKPAFINDSGYRMYTDADFAKLQKILTLKYLGFTLEEISDITLKDTDQNYIRESLQLQLQLVRKKMEHLQLVEKSLVQTSDLLENNEEIDWNHILHLIYITNMEKSLVEQYKNSANVAIRIQLHRDFSTNSIGWFPWIFSNLNIQPHQKILEIGCGNGEMWKVNQNLLPRDCSILLSDVSDGMVSDAKSNLAQLSLLHQKLSFQVFDCQDIPVENETFDLVIANHVMFYVKDRKKVLKEVFRTLKNGGCFCCSTYGKDHMKEIDKLVKEFDPRIALSDVNLYEIFGLENGEVELENYFNRVERLIFDDALIIDKVQPVLDYILSCHGNQQEYLHDRYEEFKSFVFDKFKADKTMRITKMAGIFLCWK